MPGGDGTGPFGKGPMTGRAAGRCAGSAVSGFMNGPGGRGFGGAGGRGGRGGRGWRNRFYATGLTGWQRAAAGMPAFGGNPSAAAPPTDLDAAPAASNEQELDLLKRQAEGFANALEQMKKRIAELELQPQKE